MNYSKDWAIGENSNQFEEKIEDFFKLLKQGLNLREIHKYTPKSIEKTVYLNVFLGALIVSQGFYSKTAIQQLSEN